MPRTPHQPTDESRRQVEALSGYGMPRERICDVIGVSWPTLLKYYDRELALGDAKALSQIAKAAFERGVIDKDTSMLIFLCKTRLGWRDVQRVENTGPNGGPIQIEESPRERITRRLAGLKVVGGTDGDSR